MTRYGNDMISELSKLLGSELVKTAAEKEVKEDKAEKKEEAAKAKEEAKEEKAAAKEEAAEAKAEAKEEKAKEKEEAAEEKAAAKAKKDKKKKKAETMMAVVQDLVKLANELDAAGAEEASGLVDDALKVIIENLEK